MSTAENDKHTLTLDTRMLAYIAKVADALNTAGLDSHDVGYGQYHIERITFGFEGEVDDRIAVAQGEHGSLEIEVRQ